MRPLPKRRLPQKGSNFGKNDKLLGNLGKRLDNEHLFRYTGDRINVLTSQSLEWKNVQITLKKITTSSRGHVEIHPGIYRDE